MYRGSVRLKLRAIELTRESGDQSRKRRRRGRSFSAVDGRSCHIEGGGWENAPHPSITSAGFA